MDSARKDQLKRNWDVATGQGLLETMPIHARDATKLFDQLNRRDPCKKGSHCFGIVEKWAVETGSKSEAVKTWLERFGGKCDCMANEKVAPLFDLLLSRKHTMAFLDKSEGGGE